MTARNCEERLERLKEWRRNNGYTLDDCVKMCDSVLSTTTVKNVFKASSRGPFRESTIAAIELHCMGKVYEPDVKIPVMDVVQAQEDIVKRFSVEARLLRHTVEKQAHLIRGLISICVISIIFFGGIALYDYFSHATGFWNTDSYPIWIAKVIFLLCLSGIVCRWAFVLRQIKTRFEAEERAAAEAEQ